jgi:hypothetical protein
VITKDGKKKSLHAGMGDKMVFEPRYNNLASALTYISVIYWIFQIFGEFAFEKAIKDYFVFISACVTIWLPLIAFQVKRIEIYKNAITLKRVFIKKKYIIFFDEINYIEEKNFWPYSGWDYLLIKTSQKNFRIFCTYVQNYKKLKKITINLFEKQK